MIACPFCGATNLEGADLCEQCQEPLTQLDEPTPRDPIARQILADTLRKLRPRAPVCVAPDTHVEEVLRLMAEERCGCILVTEGERLVGLFSERDAIGRLGAEANAHAKRAVGEVMTPDPQTLEMDDPIAYGLQRFAVGDYRHLPLTENGRLAGLLSVRDVLRWIREQTGSRATRRA